MGERVSNCHMGYQARAEFSGFVSKITRITEALIGGFFNTSEKVSRIVCKITYIMKALSTMQAC